MSLNFDCPHCHGPLVFVAGVRAGKSGEKPKVDNRTVATDAEAKLIEEFRDAYLETVDSSYRGFGKPYPAAEIRCARRLLARCDRAWITAVINWTVGDRVQPTGNSSWTGWGNQVRSVAKLQDKFHVLEQKCRAAMAGRQV